MKLEAQLSALEKTMLVRRLPDADTAYLFKHVLVQDAVYSSLLKNDRRELHRSVGRILERDFSDRLDEFAPVLATHFREAEEPERAYAYSVRAGDQAARLLAHEEAISHYQVARQTALQLPSAPSDLGGVMLRLGREFELGTRYPEALATYDELEAGAEEAGDDTSRLRAVMAKTTLYATPTPLFNIELGEKLSGEALVLAQSLSDEPAQAKILWQRMLLKSFANLPAEALEVGERSIQLARRLGLKEQLAYCLNDICSIYATAGRVAEGEAAALEAKALWVEIGNLPMLTDALSNLALFHTFQGNLQRGIEDSNEAYNLSLKIGNLWGRSFSRMFIGMAYSDLGQFDLCLESMRESIEYSKLSGFIAPQVFTQSFLGWTYAWLGQPERGLATLDEAERVSRKGFPTWVAWPILFRAAIKIRTEDFAGAQAILVPGESPSRWKSELSWTYLFLPMPLLMGSLYVGLGEFDQALQQADRLFEDLASAGMVSYRGDGHILRARALRGIGRLAEARSEVQAGVALCREHKIQRVLWESLAMAGDLEGQAGNPQAAENLRAEAGQVVQTILSTIPDADLRASFRSTAGVCALLGSPT